MPEPFLRIQSRLTDRDHTLLGWLADHGVLTTFQIAHALFPSLDFAQRRLRRLCDAGLLTRFRPFRADGGTHPYHYVLDQLGVEVVATHRGEDLPRKDKARQRRWHLTNRANLPHLLGTNQFFIELAGHARTDPSSHLLRWWSTSQCLEPGALADDPDDNQQRYYQPVIRPDGHGIWQENGATVPFFLEYDTGTETVGRLVDKVAGYAALARVTGLVWPVLFWLHATAREHNLHRRLTDAQIWVPVATGARDATTNRGSPAEAVWWLHGRPGGRRQLADLATAVRDDRYHTTGYAEPV
jgi:hypothetical protein